MATFLFIFAFSTFIFSEISGFDSFVYKNAPPEMIKAAKQIGQNERLSFIQELQNRKHSDEEKINLYSNHLSACSSVANELSEKLAATLGEEAKKPIELSESRTTKQVLSAIGIDAVSVALMTMPMSEMAETIHAACLKNELQFQCAFGFIEDRDKILAHILAMTENDGNVKMMFDVECKRPELAPLTYACIGDNAQKLMAECGTSIGAYNDTRTEVNIRMGLTYADVMTVIENSMNRAASEAELIKLMAESNDLMAATLRGLSRLEAFKCRSYYQMERCLSKAVNKFCGVDSVNALTTILRVGYLRRERGEDLHNQFVESQVPPTKACSKTFNS